MFVLKNYQENTLEVLKDYLEQARFLGASAAFNKMQHISTPYKPLTGLEQVPFICLRLPTGGGKTLLSAYTIPIAADKYLETEFPLVLWLVPTNTIRKQTLETLQKPNHPNYETLRKAFDGKFMVIDIADFEQLRPQDIKSKAVIVLGTIQTLRVDKTEGRKVYAHNENLEPHFTKVSSHAEGLERVEDGDYKGQIKFSFRNLLAIHRPLVIVDEAHNASSKLSFEVLERINPACVVEYTATPEHKTSNVLYNVAASELKAEEMIKLPIMLSPRSNWQEAVGDSIRRREQLHDLAKNDKKYIRPIVLFQAENKDKEVTYKVLQDYLVNVEKINIERIAVVTGDQRELDDVNLFDPQCKIDFVITVDALKEGWDCSFAYVFCSLANVQSKTAIEQLLGRVLRMPYAKRREQEELNKAYAFVTSQSWGDTVSFLHDRLVQMGFDQQEADSCIEQDDFGFKHGQPTPTSLREPEPFVFQMQERPDLSSFEENRVSINEVEEGFEIKVSGVISGDAEIQLIKAIPKDKKHEIQTRIGVHNANVKRLQSPAEQGEVIKIPQLCVWINGELDLVEKEMLLDANGWNLLDFPTSFNESEFKLHDDAKTYEIDLKDDRLSERLIGNIDQLNLDLVDTGWTAGELSRWLNHNLQKTKKTQDIKWEVILEYLRRVIASFEEKNKIPITAIVRARFLLAKFLLSKINTFRVEAYNNSYQQTLFAPEAKVETSFEYNFTFEKHSYSPKNAYNGSYQFSKHLYGLIGDLKSKGEEYECAKAIDENRNVKHWVRNVDRQEHSFYLPTSQYRFYPDFVAELYDGRILVIEYKGKDRSTNDDSKEKDNIGRLWEERSGGKGLFLMAVTQDDMPSVYKQIENKIAL